MLAARGGAGAKKRELQDAVLAATGRPLSDMLYTRLLPMYATAGAATLWRLKSGELHAGE